MSASAQRKETIFTQTATSVDGNGGKVYFFEDFHKKKRRYLDFSAIGNVLSKSANSIMQNKPSAVFDFAIGAGVSGGTKALLMGVGGMMGASALPLAFAAGVGAAFVKSSVQIYLQCEKERGDDSRIDWVKNNWRSAGAKLLRTTVLSSLGSAFALFAVPFLGDVFESLTKDFNFGSMFAGFALPWAKTNLPSMPVETPKVAVPAQPVITVPETPEVPAAIEAAPAPAATPTEIPANVTETPAPAATPTEIPANVTETPEPAAFVMPEGAQAQKDLAVSLLSGENADPARAIELFQSAADAGNIQAKVDLAYLNYHGLAGLTADHEGAIEAMRVLAENDSRAADLMAQWEPKAEIFEAMPAAPAVEEISLPLPQIDAGLPPELSIPEISMPAADVAPAAPQIIGVSELSVSFTEVNAQGVPLSGVIENADALGLSDGDIVEFELLRAYPFIQP